MAPEHEETDMAETNATHPRVLVGVDGSPDGLRAVRLGSGWVRRAGGGTLRLVHVIDDAVLAGAWGVAYDPSVLESAGEQAISEARSVALEQGLDEATVVHEVLFGNAATVLSQQSEEADLLVVGRRAMSGLERMFVGSTSASVAGSASCPVLVVSQDTTPGPIGSKGVFVVGLDAAHHSSETLNWALEQASMRTQSGSPTHVKVVHVLAPLPTGLFDAASPSVVQGIHEAAEQGVRDLVEQARSSHPEVEVEVEVLAGGPVDVLVSQSTEADLLVMGVQRSGPLSLLGGTMRGVLAHSRCPVAVIH